MAAKLGELDRADGSGRFAFGPAAALASFTGPIEVRIRDEKVERATLEVVHRPLEGIGSTPSRALEDALRVAFEPLLALSAHPRSLVQLVVQSLVPASGGPGATTPAFEPDTSDMSGTTSWPPKSFPAVDDAVAPLGPGGGMSARAAALNASSLAALHAGSVGVRAVPLAVAIALVSGDMLVDPSLEEEAAASARFVFAWALGTGIGASAKTDAMDDEATEAEIVWADAEGAFSRQQYDEAAAVAHDAVNDIFAFVQTQFETFFSARQ